MCILAHLYGMSVQQVRFFSAVERRSFHLVTQEAKPLRRQGFIVLAMGDFNPRVGNIPGLEDNTADTNQNTSMFLAEVNMVIVNSLPISKGLFTRFMDNSGHHGTKSLLDYGLIDGDHVNTITSFTIDEEVRFDCGSDHALLECNLEFGVLPRVKWSYQDVSSLISLMILTSLNITILLIILLPPLGLMYLRN